VEERRAERVGVEPHPGADLGDPDRMGDEFVAGVPLLIAVVIAGEIEGPLHLVAVDRRDRDRGATESARRLLVGRVELLDDREQVAEQLLTL